MEKGALQRNNQFRATKLWNEVVNEFRKSMRPTRHRRQFRIYDDCFTGTEATDWMHKHLTTNPNFGSGVTREKSVLLLNKFINAGIIEDAKGKRRAFDDSKRLFRFLPDTSCTNNAFEASEKENDFRTTIDSPLKPAAPQQTVQFARIRTNILTDDLDLSDVWKTVVFSKIRRMLQRNTEIDGILAFIECSADDVCHNLYNLSKNGVVILRNKSDDLPPYVIHAMKCLIKWPTLNGLLDYPGFQIDVLKVVNDFYDCQSLLSEPLYRLFIAIFRRFMDADALNNRAQPQVPTRAPMVRFASDLSGESIEELMNDLTMQTTNPFGKSPVESPPPDYHYETAFVTATPCTRIISRTAMQVPLHQPVRSAVLPSKIMPMAPPPPLQPRQAVVCPTSQFKRSVSPWERRSVTSIASSTSTRSSASSMVNGYVNLAFGSASSICTARSTASGTPALPLRSLGAPATCYAYRSLQDCAQPDTMIDRKPGSRRSLDLPLKSTNYRETISTREYVCQCLQIASLLISPIKRRYLHLLLRFIYKTARNTALELHPGKMNMDVLLDTFSDSLCPYWTADLQCRELLRFLSDYCDTIFAVPEGVKSEIETRLNILRDAKEAAKKSKQTSGLIVAPPKAGGDNGTPVLKSVVSYCKQMTSEQYREQGKVCSTNALNDLLEFLLTKTAKGDDPEQLRRLKLFEECYPLICAKRKPDIDQRLGRRPSASNVRRSTSFSFDHKLINTIRL